MGPGLAILLDNPLLILVIIFGLGGWFGFFMAGVAFSRPVGATRSLPRP